ncbi:RNA-directed DNA polymerase from mobile element jockey-like 14, partial [Homarus americanus]
TSEREVTNGRKCQKRLRKEDDFSNMANMSRAIHPVAEPPTFAIPTMMKYKIPKEIEFDHAYEVVVALELEYKNMKFSVKPNLIGDLILSPQDHNTAKILSEVSNLNGKAIKIIPLDPEEKTTRMVLLLYPLELPVEVVTKHSKLTKAERCYKSGQSTDKASASGHQGDSPRGGRPRQLGDLQVASFCPRTTTMLQMSEIWTSPIQVPQKREMWHLQPKPHDRNKQGRNHHDSQVPKLWKETSRLEHIMPREERANESCNGKSSKQNRSTSEHIRVGSIATEYSQPNTHSAPKVRGFLPCTSFTRLQDKIEDTRTKSVHAENHDKPVDSSTAAPELCSSKRTEHSSIGGEHHIAWDTATPLGDHPTEYTPACQSTSGIHRRTNKTDDHYYDSDFLYDNAETRYQHRKQNKRSYDTARRKDAGRPDPQNSTTTSGTDDALETDIRQEEQLAIQEITQNREASSPLQQITRNRTTNTDRQQTHDHRQERQHPEERRKNSRDSTSCSSLRAGAQETATTPDGRGGERLDHERREQLQHQRRGDNDRIAPPPCYLKITQWNIQGLSNKRHTVQAAALAKNIVFILQETLMSKDQQFRLPGYQQYSVPKGPNSHGSMILVRATIPSSEVEPVHCGDGVEAQAIRIHLANDSLVVYNIYKPPTKRLKAGELLTQATQELVLIAGDFNVHHPTINSTTRMNLDGRHLVELLTDVPEITLINTGEPTHILGGTLDLTFISTEFVPVGQWEVDNELTSDPFATTTTLRMELLPPLPRPPPRWNTKKANWKLYQDELQKWFSNYEPAEDLDQLNQDLTGAIQHAVEKAIPKTNPTNRHHKDYWFYNDEVREQNHRINTFRRHLRQYPSPEGVKLLRAAVQHARQITQKFREDKWLEWCATFNAHTSLSELWRKLRIATGKLPRSPAQPLQEANRLAEYFAERSSAQLPPEIRLHLQQVHMEREVVVRHAIEQADTTDCLFTIDEIRRARKTDTAPGSDDRIGKRVNLMRAMTGPKVGAGHVVLRTLYIHAIRSLTDYATPALNALSEGQWAKLEVAQNNAMRAIVKAPMWTKIENLHMETGLASLQTRAERLTACFATKLITRAREGDIKNGLLRALNLNRDVFNKKTWLLCPADAVNRLKLEDTILSKGPDTMSPDYSTPAPWESPPAIFNILQTGTRKADCNPHELRQIAERNMKALTPHNCTVYYTDGSVEITSTKAGAAFTIEGDGCSTLQVELAAILGALRHASINSQQGIVIHTDSR